MSGEGKTYNKMSETGQTKIYNISANTFTIEESKK